MKKLKKFDNFTTVNVSDLENNWSPEYYKFKKEGKNPYIKKGGKLEKVDVKKSIPKDAIYITSTQALKYNKITKEIIKLEELQEKILKNK